MRVVKLAAVVAIGLALEIVEGVGLAAFGLNPFPAGKRG